MLIGSGGSTLTQPRLGAGTEYVPGGGPIYTPPAGWTQWAAGGPSPTPPPKPAPFDWKTAIMGDPFYQQALAQLTAQGIADKQTLASFVKRAVTDFGVLPDFGSLGFDPIAEAGIKLKKLQALAAENTQAGTSIEARLADADAKARMALRSQLAARGLLMSGETGYQTGELNKTKTQAEYDARQKLLDALASAHGQYVQAMQQIEWQKMMAAIDAANRVSQTQPPGTTTLPPTTTTPGSAQPTVGTEYSPPPSAKPPWDPRLS